MADAVPPGQRLPGLHLVLPRHGRRRPAGDRSRITVQDHVDDLLALLDHEGVERAVVACWSMGVNIGFELALRHPDRVAGILSVAGVPGGTFQAMFGLLQVPRALRHDLGVGVAQLMRAAGPLLDRVAAAVPLNRTTARLIAHSGLVLPAATPDRLIPALDEFRRHDFRWYFTLAVAAKDHHPLDLSALDVPVTFLAGRYDLITHVGEIERAAAQVPHAKVDVLPGSHFLPLEYPDEVVQELADLVAKTDLVG